MDNNLTFEEWHDIPGFPGYQASSLGRLKSLEREAWNPRGKGFSFLKRERILTAKPDNEGYLSHSVHSDSQPDKETFLAHRLIALAFHPNPENKPFINHKNGVKTDNRPSNLEWCTRSENGIHAVLTGLHTALRGETNGNSLLTESDVREIRSKYATGAYRIQDLAVAYGVSRTTAGYVIKGRLWAHTMPEPQTDEDQERASSLRASLKSRSLSESLKGREGKKGSSHPKAKLTEESVRSIRERFIPRRYTVAMLAHDYGVTKATIKAVLNRRLWAHV